MDSTLSKSVLTDESFNDLLACSSLLSDSLVYI